MSDDDSEEEIVVTEDDIKFASVIGLALKKDKELGQELDITKMREPGTVIWTDPSTNEELYSSPGDRAYSMALMFAIGIVQEDGTVMDMT